MDAVTYSWWEVIIIGSVNYALGQWLGYRRGAKDMAEHFTESILRKIAERGDG